MMCQITDKDLNITLSYPVYKVFKSLAPQIGAFRPIGTIYVYSFLVIANVYPFTSCLTASSNSKGQVEIRLRIQG